MSSKSHVLTINTPIGVFEKAVTSPDKDELSSHSDESSSVSSDLLASENDIFENNEEKSVDDDIANTKMNEKSVINNIHTGVTVSTNFNYILVADGNQEEVSEINSNISEITCSIHDAEKSIDIESIGAGQFIGPTGFPFNVETDTPHRPSSVVSRNIIEMVMQCNNLGSFISSARNHPEYNSNDIDSLNDIFNSHIKIDEDGESFEKISNRLINLQTNFEYMKNDMDNFSNVYNIINDLHQENELLRNGLANSRNENILYCERIKYLETSVCSLQKDTYSSYLEFKSMQNKLTLLESELDKFQQYNRRESLEVSGIPENIPQSELEITMINVLRRIGLNDLNSYQIAACHRLKRRVGNEQTSRVIIRFVNRKNSYKCLISKKYLRDIREFPNIYFHESLCYKYKDLYDECMDLKSTGIISKLWTYNGIINVKKSYNYNERPKKIYSKSDIKRYFPDSV